MREKAFKPLGLLSLTVFVFPMLASDAFCQSASSSGAGGVSPLLLQFEQNQQTLTQQMAQLSAQGATPAQIANQPSVLAQKSLAIQVGTALAAQPLPQITSVMIPDDASQDLESFLATQASLFNLRVQIHNQLTQRGAVSGQQELTKFHQQAATTLQAQALRFQRIALSASLQPMSQPPPLVLPPNASPTLQAFLTLRYQLMCARIQVVNQNLSLGPAARAIALIGWRRDNASQFQQLQTLAQQLTPPTP